MTGSTAAISVAVPRARQGLAMGIWGAVGGIGLGLGPLYGAVLTDAFGWRSIYWSDLVLILIAGIATYAGIVGLSRPAKARLDLVGATLLGASIVFLVIGIQTIPVDGPSAPLVLGALSLGLVCISAFGAWSARRPPEERFFDTKLFRYPAFVGGCVISFAAFGAVFSVLYFYNLYSQSVVVLDDSAVGASIALLPFGITLVVLSIVVGRMADIVGFRLPLALGTTVAALGFLVLADLPTGAGGIQLWLGLGMAGVGVGAIYVTAAAAGLAVIPREFLGEAAGVINTMRYAGGSVAVAVGATLYVTVGVGTFNRELRGGGEPAAETSQLDNALTGTNDGLENALDELAPTGEGLVASSAEAAITDGFRAAMAVLAVFMIAATLTAAFTLGPGRREEVHADGSGGG